MIPSDSISQVLEQARHILLTARSAPSSEWESQESLANFLYDQWFHQWSHPEPIAYPDGHAYRAVCLQQLGLQPDWYFVAHRPDQGIGAIAVRNHSEERIILPPAYAPEHPQQLRLRAGDALRVCPIVEQVQNGFWHHWSMAWYADPPQPLRRLYFHVAVGHELAFLQALVASAPQSEGWAIKILAGIHPHRRVDVAVFYFHRGILLSCPWLLALKTATQPFLAPGIPPLTAHLGPGLAWADDPGGPVSFGQHRCQLLAAAAIKEPDSLVSTEAWCNAVAAQFTQAGLDLSAPEAASHAL